MTCAARIDLAGRGSEHNILGSRQPPAEYGQFHLRLRWCRQSHPQTVSATVTNYLLDLQPGLVDRAASHTGSKYDPLRSCTARIHAQKDASGNWEWMLQDGLGSVRMWWIAA